MLLITSVLVSQQVKADEVNYAIGGSAGSLGLGLSASSTTPFHIFPGDKIQLRAVISGFEGDDEMDVSIAGIDYEATDYSKSSLQGGVDWYPIQSSGWMNKLFISGGVIYQNDQASYSAENDKPYTIGSTNVAPGDLDSFTADVERNDITPYISLGWGNKIDSTSGFSFQAEIGVALSSNDPAVELQIKGLNHNVTAADLEEEKKNIQDDLGGVVGFASASITYHF